MGEWVWLSGCGLIFIHTSGVLCPALDVERCLVLVSRECRAVFGETQLPLRAAADAHALSYTDM